MKTFFYSSTIPAAQENTFGYHTRTGALTRLLPQWERAVVENPSAGLAVGKEVLIHLHKGPFHIPWLARHVELDAPRRFVDRQVRGPFKDWLHEHLINDETSNTCGLIDNITYELPLSALTTPLIGGYVSRELNRVFQYRHEVTSCDLKMIGAYPSASNRGRKVLLSGSSGMIGSALSAFLDCAGWEVFSLVRHPPRGPRQIAWSPTTGLRDSTALPDFDVVIHLAGEPISGYRWSEEKKKRIRDSRVVGTRNIVALLSQLAHPPKVFLCASAIGFYGNRGAEVLDEQSSEGDTTFLSSVAAEWEQCLEPLTHTSIRSAALRFGVVLSPRGGALRAMLPAFSLGAAGRLGDGQQYMSWISLDDAVYAIYHSLACSAIHGPVNVVAPQPVTNAEFTKTLARTLQRPAFLPAPQAVLRTVFGEMADELLLASVRVVPTKLARTGFLFQYPSLRQTLAHVLGRPASK